MEDKFLRETLTTVTRNAHTRCTDLGRLSLQKGFKTQKKERNKATDLTGHCAKQKRNDKCTGGKVVVCVIPF